jgi:sigma-E factor negative regulatory protein RseC
VIEEQGTVLAVSGDLAEVACERRSACGACSVRNGCGTSLLEQLFGRRSRVLDVRNPIGARPGERVFIGIREDALVKAAVSAYLLPLLGMILGAVGGEWLSSAALPAWEQGLSILGGLAGLGAGLWGVAVLGARREGDARFQATILRRVPHADGPVAVAGPLLADGAKDTGY